MSLCSTLLQSRIAVGMASSPSHRRSGLCVLRVLRALPACALTTLIACTLPASAPDICSRFGAVCLIHVQVSISGKRFSTSAEETVEDIVTSVQGYYDDPNALNFHMQVRVPARNFALE